MLRAYDTRMSNLIEMLEDKMSLSDVEKVQIQGLYAALKRELKADADSVNLVSEPSRLTLIGQAYIAPDIRNATFASAVRKASAALDAATFSHPIQVQVAFQDLGRTTGKPRSATKPGGAASGTRHVRPTVTPLN